MNAAEAAIAERLGIFADEDPEDDLASGGADVIPEGQRDHALASLAGTMRRKGFSVGSDCRGDPGRQRAVLSAATPWPRRGTHCSIGRALRSRKRCRAYGYRSCGRNDSLPDGRRDLP